MHRCIDLSFNVYFFFFQDKTKIIEEMTSTCNRTNINIISYYSGHELDTLIKNKEIFIDEQKNRKTYYRQECEAYKIGDGLETKNKANFLGVIVFAIAVGIVAGRMREKAAVFVQFLSIFNDIITKLIIVAMW